MNFIEATKLMLEGKEMVSSKNNIRYKLIGNDIYAFNNVTWMKCNPTLNITSDIWSVYDGREELPDRFEGLKDLGFNFELERFEHCLGYKCVSCALNGNCITLKEVLIDINKNYKLDR